MSIPIESRHTPNDEPQLAPHDVVLTNYDRIVQDEGKLSGWERSSAEYEQRGLKGLAKKIKYSFLRQSLIRKHVKEAQRQVKSNTETLLLHSSDVNAAAKGMSLNQKPFIHPDEVNAYRESVALDDQHDERIDTRYASQQNLLESQLQNRIDALTAAGDRSQIASEVSEWVDGAIAQLPQYYRSEDKDLFTQQITQSVIEVMDRYEQAVADSKDTQAARQIKLHLAGLPKNGGKTKARVMMEELVSHPLIWTGASVASKAVLAPLQYAAPGVGGILGGLRKRQRVGEDIKRMQLERVHGVKGKQDKYRRELAKTFGEQLQTSEYIDRLEEVLRITNVNKLADADSAQVDRLITFVSSLKAIKALKAQVLSYERDSMYRDNVRLLKLESAATARLTKWGLKQRLNRSIRVDISELTEDLNKQTENQRSFKNKKAREAGAMVTAISLGTLGLAAVMPDEWTEAVTGKLASGAKMAWEHISPAASAATPSNEHAATAAHEIVNNSGIQSDGPNSSVEVGDGAAEPELDPSMLGNSSTEAEPHSLWQDLVGQQNQRDVAHDQYITYDNPDVGEFNELQIHYEPIDHGIEIDVSGMEANADGIDGAEFPENEQLYAVFYLTNHDHAIGNEIRIPIPDDGRLIIDEEHHPELLPLFHTNNSEVEQQFSRLSIATQNQDGSYTFYASNPGEDVSAKLVESMKEVKAEPNWPGVSPPNENNPLPDQPTLPEKDDVYVMEGSADKEPKWPGVSFPNEHNPWPAEGPVAPASKEDVYVMVGDVTGDTAKDAAVDRSKEGLFGLGGLAADQRGMMKNLKNEKANEQSTTPDENNPILKALGLTPDGTQEKLRALSAAETTEVIAQLDKLTGKSASAEKFLSEYGEALQFVQRVGNQIYILTPIKDETILALTFDLNKPDELKTRFWRISGSDNQWKSIPGFRPDGRQFMKGDEGNNDHHYVQSGKLNPEIYSMLNQVSTHEANGANLPQLTEFMPIKGGRFNSELEVKEEHVHLQNPEWDEYQQKMRYAYKAYEQFVTNNRKPVDLASDGELVKTIRKQIDSANTHNNKESSYFKFKPFLQELTKLDSEISSLMGGSADDITQAGELESALKSIDLTQATHANPKVAHLVEVYQQSVGDFIENVAKIKTPESIKPNFDQANIKSRYFKPNPPGQQDTGIWVEEYEAESTNGDTIRWAMAHDSQGRVYVDNVYDPQVGPTNYGTLSKIVNMGFLVYKPEDYKNQTIGIPDKYKDNPDGKYVSISRLWSENVPIIKAYAEELERRAAAAPSNSQDQINTQGGVGKELYGPAVPDGVPDIFNNEEKEPDATADQPGSSSDAGESRQSGEPNSGGYGANGGVNSQHNTGVSGNFFSNNSGPITLNNGSTGEEQLQQQQKELERQQDLTEDRQDERSRANEDRNRERQSHDQSEARQTADRQDERDSRDESERRAHQNQQDERRSRDEASVRQDEDRSTERSSRDQSEARQTADRQNERTQKNQDRQNERETNLEHERLASQERLERDRINSQERQATSESYAQAQQQTAAAMTELANTIKEFTQNHTPEIQIPPEFTAQLEQQAKILQASEADRALLYATLDRLVDVVSRRAEESSPDSDLQVVVDGMVATIDKMNQTFETALSPIKLVIDQLPNNLELQNRIAALEEAQRAEKQAIQQQKSIGLSERVRRLRQQRRLPHANPRRINRVQGRAPKDLFGRPLGTEDEPVVGNFSTPEGQQRRLSNANEAQKSKFLDYHSSGEYRKNSVKAIRDKAYGELKQLHPDRYDELQPKLSQKINQELLEPWKRNQGDKDQRRAWLKQLYDEQFYSALAAEGAESDTTSPQPETATETENSRQPDYSIDAEDKDDSESVGRAEEDNQREEHQEARAYPQRQATNRQQRQNRSQQRSSESRQPESPTEESASSQPTESEPPVDGSIQTLERLIKRFGDDQRLSDEARPVSGLQNEQFGQQYRSLYAKIGSLSTDNETTGAQRNALRSLHDSYQRLADNLSDKTSPLGRPNFGRLQTELSQVQSEVQSKISSWSPAEKPESVNNTEYKAQLVNQIKSEINQPLLEQRTKISKELAELYSAIEDVREQSSQARPTIESLPQSEDLFARGDEVLQHIEAVTGQLNQQLRDINAAVQAFEQVLAAWQQTA